MSLENKRKLGIFIFCNHQLFTVWLHSSVIIAEIVEDYKGETK